jgi:iron complex outermembrane receptor protein
MDLSISPLQVLHTMLRSFFPRVMYSCRGPAICLLFGAVLVSAQAQDPGATIQGVLTVPTVSARDITKVTVTITETGQTAAVDEAGRYVFTHVAPGTYTLLAAGEGFSRLRLTEVSVDAGTVTDVGRREMPILIRDGKVLSEEESIQSQRETDVLKLDRFVVQSAKPPAFTDANVDIPRGENDVQPYRIITGEEMEFSGSLTVEDFLKEKLSMDGTERSNNQIYTGGIGTTSSISLRGLGPDRTLVLINGRRVQGTDQQVSNLYGMQPDLNSIPQSAIDRIEILPSGASAIYGASAIGGVINVVLKQGYTGGRASVTYQNTFNTDSPVRVANVLYGLSLEGGRTQIQVTATYRNQAPIFYQDMPEIALRGIANVLANRPVTYYSPTSPPSLGTTTNIATSSPTLTLDNGTPLNARFTYIPVGTSPTTPTATLYAGLLANAGKYNLEIDSGDGVYSLNNQIGTAPTAKAFSASIVRQMSSWLQLNADLRYGDNQGEQVYNRISRAVVYTVPGNAPTNPFRETVSIHFPTRLGTKLRTHTTTKIANLGAVAQLPGDWRAILDLSWSENHHRFYSFVDDTPAGNAALANGTVNPFVDTTLYPVDLIPYVASYSYDGTANNKSITARVSGTVFDLWAGRPMLTFGAGHQIQGYGDTKIMQRMPFTTNNTVDLVYLPQEAKTSHAYTEAQIPLVRPINKIPLIASLDMQLAARLEMFEVGTGTPSYLNYFLRNPPLLSYAAPNINSSTPLFQTAKYDSMNYTAGFKYVPHDDFILRWSIATAFIPPTAGQLQPAPLPSTATTTIDDPTTGKTYDVQTQGGGNRNLTPQNTVNWNAGLIYEPKKGKLKGVRLEANYFHIKEKDLIGSLTVQQIINNPSLQNRVTRDPATNLITLVDTSLLNLSYYEMSGWDFSAAFRKTLPIGRISIAGQATLYDSLIKQVNTTSSFLEYVGWPHHGGVPDWRGSGTVAWGRKGLTLGWTSRYISSYGVYGSPGAPVTSATYTTMQGSDHVPGQLYHDIFGSYFFGRGAQKSGESKVVRSLLKGLSLKAGIRDLFNTAPPYDAFRGPYYYSNYGSARMREYWITVGKDF